MANGPLSSAVMVLAPDLMPLPSTVFDVSNWVSLLVGTSSDKSNACFGYYRNPHFRVITDIFLSCEPRREFHCL